MQIAQLTKNIETTETTTSASKRLPPFLSAPAPRPSVLAQAAIARRNCFAGHYESPDIANFPSAVTAFVFWGIGLITAACGILGDSVALTIIGSFGTLLAGILHGWSLCDA